MPRPEKVQAVADIKERLANAQAVFLAEYAGLSVTEQQQLRRALRATEGQFKVVKMTLARLAADELGHSDLAELLTGPTGLTFADRDAAATAKALRDFANDHANLTIKGALLSGDVISADQVSELADLPSREVLLSQIAGAFEAPMAKLASLLGAMPRDLATMVQQLIEKMGGDAPDDEPEPVAEAPAEAPAEEAAVEEAPAESAEAPAEDAPAEKAAAEEAPAEEAPAEAPAEEAAAESAEAPAEETDAGEKPGAADETNDENDQADEAEEE